MAGLHFDITADNRTLLSTLEESRRAVSNAMKNIEESGMSVENVFHRIERAAALSVAGFSLKGVIDQAIETRSYFEDIESSMRVFLGSQEKAVDFTKKLQDAAYYNMFEFSDLADASKQLIAYRNNAEDVIPIINKLSEVAVATKTPLAEMVSLYNRAKSTGTVDSNAIQSWATKGLVLKDVMKDLGVVTAGTSLSFEQLNMALDHVTEEGGMFHGIQDSMMENLSSNIGQLEDNLSLMFNDIGSHLQGVANTGIKAAGDLVDHWQDALAVIATIATSYGVNKAVEVGGIAINKASTSYGYDVELEQLRSLLPAKEQEEQSTLKQAVASGRLSEAKALEIEETRKQVDALLEEATAREALAKSEADSARDAADAAQEKLRGLEEEKQGWLELYTEATNAGDAELAQSIASEIATKETEINEAANLANAASEQAKSAAANLATVSTERETLATQINTAQTAGNTAAKDALSIASARLRVAMDKLNKVIEANKFAILTAALFALGAAIYKICTYESDFSKMIKSADEAAQSQEKSMREEISTLNKLKSSLESAKKGSAEWKDAKDNIISQFGKYHSGLDEEIQKTGTLAESYHTLTKAIRLSAAARAMEKFRSENDNSEEVDEFLEGIRRDLSGKNFKIGVDGEIDRSEGLKFVSVGGKLRESIMQKVFEWMDDGDLSRFTPQELGYLNQTGAFSYHAGRAGAKRIRENAEKLKKGENLIAERYGTTVEEIDGRTPLIEEKETTLKEAYEEAKKKYEEQKALVAKMDKDRGSYSAKDYENAVSALKGLKTEYEKYGGQTKEKKSGPTSAQLLAKEENAAGKLADVIRKQGQERLRLEQDYEYERWKTRIDLMEEGEAKVLAQQKLDFKKERTALQRRKEQEIESELQRQMALFDAQENVKAAADKKYVKKTFRDSDIDQSQFDAIESRYGKLEADLSATQKKAEQDRLDAAKESMNAYLKEFGSYQQKRLAIQEEYETKISEAQNDGERMMFIGQRNKALSDLDYDEWVETGEIALAFGDIQNLSSDTVTKLISDMERYREKVIATFDPEKIQKYEDALSSLRNIKTEDSFGIFSSAVPDYFKQRKSIGSQIDSAGSNLNALETQLTRLRMEAQALKNSIGLTRSMGGDTSEMESRLMEVNVQLSENENAIKKARNAFRALQEQWDSLDTPEAKFYALCDSIIYYADLAGGLASQASEMAEAMGAEGLASALGTLSETMNSVENIASGFANGGIIGGIAAGVGEVMKWATKLFQAGDNKKQKNIERLQEQIDALNKSYEKLGKLADDAFSTDASDLIDQQNTLLKQQQVLIKQQMAEEEAKKKTDDDKIKQYKEQLDEINETLAENRKKAKEAIIGEDLKSAINEFASLYAEAWNDGTDAAQKSMAAVKNIISSALSELLKKNIQPAATRFYDALAEAMKDGVLTDAELDNLDAIKRQIDALAASSEEQYKMIQDRYRDLDELKEELTDISFDSVRDNFKSKLADMSSTAKDFIDDFSSMLRDALINGLMDEKYDLMLREWYDEFAEAMNDRSLTDSERDALRQQYDAIVQQGLADRDFINSIVGGGAYSQEASKGWSTALTQDQGDELNGRFTALTELEAINNTLVTEGNMIAVQILDTLRSLSALSMTSDGEDSTIREIRDMMFLSTGHLENIAKYTKQLGTIREGIDNLNDLINQRL